jgi:hypothetical protein
MFVLLIGFIVILQLKMILAIPKNHFVVILKKKLKQKKLFHVCISSFFPLVAKSLGGTAQAPFLGNRAWDHRSGSELGRELERELGSELGHGLRAVRVWVSV